MKIYVDLYKGFICKNLVCQFNCSYEPDPESKIKTFAYGQGWGSIRISYALCIKAGYKDRSGIFITDKQFGSFRVLLKNSIKLISENLYDLFPNIGSPEFEISTKALERFKMEKVQSSMNITIVPTVYVSTTQETFPGLCIDDGRGGTAVLPLEDAVSMHETLKSLDPINLSMNIIQMLRMKKK